MTVYLMITGVIFCIIGLSSLLDPVAALSTTLGIQLQTVDAFSQLRGTAGGVTLAAGAFLVCSPMRPQLRQTALWLLIIVLGGLECGRLLSLCLDGLPGKRILFSASAEVFGLLQAIYWLRRGEAPGSAIGSS